MSRVVAPRVFDPAQRMYLDTMQQAMASMGQYPPPGLEIEQRKAMLTYFVFRGPPPEEKQQNRTWAIRLDKDEDTGAVGDSDNGIEPPRTPVNRSALLPLPRSKTTPVASGFEAPFGPPTSDVEDDGVVDHEDAVDCEVRTSHLSKKYSHLLARVCLPPNRLVLRR